MIRHYCDGCNKELANEEMIKVRVNCTKLLHTTDWETLEMCVDCARRAIPEHIIYDAEQNTKIDWCDTTWNPVTGCLHGCEYSIYIKRIRKNGISG